MQDELVYPAINMVGTGNYTTFEASYFNASTGETYQNTVIDFSSSYCNCSAHLSPKELAYCGTTIAL